MNNLTQDQIIEKFLTLIDKEFLILDFFDSKHETYPLPNMCEHKTHHEFSNTLYCTTRLSLTNFSYGIQSNEIYLKVCWSCFEALKNNEISSPYIYKMVSYKQMYESNHKYLNHDIDLLKIQDHINHGKYEKVYYNSSAAYRPHLWYMTLQDRLYMIDQQGKFDYKSVMEFYDIDPISNYNMLLDNSDTPLLNQLLKWIE